MTDLQSQKWQYAHIDSPEYKQLYYLKDVDKKYFLKIIKKNPICHKIRNLGRKKLRILEVGCGSGSLSVSLALEGHDVTTVDISEHMLAAAQQLTKRTSELFEKKIFIQFGQADIHDLSLYAGQYDIVINIALLQVWDNPGERTQLLKNLGNCLTKEGLLFVSLTNTTNPLLKLMPIKGLVQDAAQCSMNTLLQEVSDAGLSCVSSQYLGLSETFDQWLRFRIFKYPLFIANFLFLNLPEKIQALCAPHSLVIAKNMNDPNETIRAIFR